MEKIVYAGPINLCQHSTTDLARGIQAAFLYSIDHQRAGKTSLFHMRGGDFSHFNTCYTFKILETLEGLMRIGPPPTSPPPPGRTAPCIVNRSFTYLLDYICPAPGPVTLYRYENEPISAKQHDGQINL